MLLHDTLYAATDLPSGFGLNFESLISTNKEKMLLVCF